MTKYLEVNLPDTERTEWKAYERRAELARIAVAAGTLDAIETTKICSRYGVTAGQISQDKTVLRKYFNEVYTQKDDTLSEILLALRRALRGALKEQNWKLVSDISLKLLDVMFNLGIIEKTPEKLDVNWKEEVKKLVTPRLIKIKDEDLE